MNFMVKKKEFSQFRFPNHLYKYRLFKQEFFVGGEEWTRPNLERIMKQKQDMVYLMLLLPPLLLRKQSQAHLFHLERHPPTFIDMKSQWCNGSVEACKKCREQKIYMSGIDSKKQLPFVAKHKRTAALSQRRRHTILCRSIRFIRKSQICQKNIRFFAVYHSTWSHWRRRKKVCHRNESFWNFRFGNYVQPAAAAKQKRNIKSTPPLNEWHKDNRFSQKCSNWLIFILSGKKNKISSSVAFDNCVTLQQLCTLSSPPLPIGYAEPCDRDKNDILFYCKR